MKFDVCGLFRKFWRKFKFGEDLSLILGTLLKDMYIYECSIDAVQKKIMVFMTMWKNIVQQEGHISLYNTGALHAR
jgi:hypothetical protein